MFFIFFFHFPKSDTFKKLKQRVLWKYEDESFTDIPSNVLIKKWLPQSDILAHPNVVLFISHGGMASTTESMYHGVPLLVIPFFGDQFRNAHRVSSAGYGKILKYNDISEESFMKYIKGMINDKSYSTKAKHTSAVFKDNILHPLDEAVFWIEHVAKFKGAKHLKSHAIEMSWFTYLSLDVIFANLLGILIGFTVLFHLVKALFRKKNSVTNLMEKLNKND